MKKERKGKQKGKGNNLKRKAESFVARLKYLKKTMEKKGNLS